MEGNLNFELVGDIYQAEKRVSSSFALHLESDEIGVYRVLQMSDANATRPSTTAVFNQRTDVDVQFQNIGLSVLIVVQSTVPITYGSIIEA